MPPTCRPMPARRSDGQEGAGGGQPGWPAALVYREPGLQRAEEQRVEPGARLQRRRALRGLLLPVADSAYTAATAGEGKSAPPAGPAAGQEQRGGILRQSEEHGPASAGKFAQPALARRG